MAKENNWKLDCLWKMKYVKAHMFTIMQPCVAELMLAFSKTKEPCRTCGNVLNNVVDGSSVAWHLCF